MRPQSMHMYFSMRANRSHRSLPSRVNTWLRHGSNSASTICRIGSQHTLHTSGASCSSAVPPPLFPRSISDAVLQHPSQNVRPLASMMLTWTRTSAFGCARSQCINRLNMPGDANSTPRFTVRSFSSVPNLHRGCMPRGRHSANTHWAAMLRTCQ